MQNVEEDRREFVVEQNSQVHKEWFNYEVQAKQWLFAGYLFKLFLKG